MFVVPHFAIDKDGRLMSNLIRMLLMLINVVRNGDHTKYVDVDFANRIKNSTKNSNVTCIAQLMKWMSKTKKKRRTELDRNDATFYGQKKQSLWNADCVRMKRKPTTKSKLSKFQSTPAHFKERANETKKKYINADSIASNLSNIAKYMWFIFDLRTKKAQHLRF